MPRCDLGFTITPLNDDYDSYRLTGRPPGWKQPFVVQDLLQTNPLDSKQYRIMGRADDLIVLATGEKVLPANLELTVAEHPDIKDVLAFGECQLCLGLLVELAADSFPADLNEAENTKMLLSSIEPYLDRGNSLTDNHGKVTKEMIIFTRESTKPLLRTDKGSLARKANLVAFETEIRACYQQADILNGTPLPLPDVEGGHALLNSIRTTVRDITGYATFGDDDDFFEAGMDSLQASRLRRSTLARLRATPNLPQPVIDLPSDFCFENSSVRKLHHAVTELMRRTNADCLVGQSIGMKRIAAMEAMVEKYRHILLDMSCLAFRARVSKKKQTPNPSPGFVVLLTGSTGSLGCFLLARLAKDSAVSRIICLNRPQPGDVDIYQRHMDRMVKRGISLPAEAWKKVVLYDADMSQEYLGLDDDAFGEVCIPMSSD